MDFNIAKHIAAISPYFKILQQPAVPASRTIDSAVYLFRHGIIHVNGHDYHYAIAPFLQKLRTLQESGNGKWSGRLAFLTSYSSWITEDDVGKISARGLQQSRDLGRTFRARYSAWLESKAADCSPWMDIWSDSAKRCEESARAFGQGFAGEEGTQDSLQRVSVEAIVVDGEGAQNSCDNLCWHQKFKEIDQSAGQHEANRFLDVYTAPILERLRPFANKDSALTPQDVYSMQLLCCYDPVAGKSSPFNELFDRDDWLGFEYMRDIKYHYSEGYGADHTGEYATPWLDAAMRLSQKPISSQLQKGRLPLWVAFTHREEILYLAVLLGLAYDGPEAPKMDRLETERSWRVTSLSPYLGHIGLERFRSLDGQHRMRIVVNGEVVSGFKGEILQDRDGGYDIRQVQEWVQQRIDKWDAYKGGRLTFLDG